MTSAAFTPDLVAMPGRRGLAGLAIRRFIRRPVAVVSLLVLLAVLIAGALAPVIAPHGWNWIDLSPSVVHRPPSLAHLFGTDPIGRDMLDRTLYGIRTTEETAFGAAALATLLGVLAGALAGYYRGWLDVVVMRIADLVTAYPAVILTLAAIVYLGEVYPHDLILIFGGYMWAVVARVVRAHIAALRTHEFVEAARALGASDLCSPTQEARFSSRPPRSSAKSSSSTPPSSSSIMASPPASPPLSAISSRTWSKPSSLPPLPSWSPAAAPGGYGSSPAPSSSSSSSA